MNSSISFGKDLIVGFCIGAANIIPGVSGGTFLLVFGIYERVIGAIGGLGPRALKEGILRLSTLPRRSAGAWRELHAFAVNLDLFFLGRILIGAAAAIIALSSLMKFLLRHHFVFTYAFFFGLILVSIAIPWRLLRRPRKSLLFFGLAGAALTVLVTAAVNPYDKIKIKSEHYRVRYERQQLADRESGVSDVPEAGLAGKYRLSEYVMIFIAGAVSVSAMVLPGISGSLMLILLGQYYEVVNAIANLRQFAFDSMLFLAVFAIGMALGLAGFARVVGFVFERFHDQTMAFLTGLMIGSLYALWPFKEMVTIDQYVKESGSVMLQRDVAVYTNINVLPENLGQLALALVFCMIGAAIMASFVGRETESASHQARS
jgi:putative membrane protein